MISGELQWSRITAIIDDLLRFRPESILERTTYMINPPGTMPRGVEDVASVDTMLISAKSTAG